MQRPKRDMRRINKVWDACNRLGEWHTYARVGSGKNSYIKTISAGAMGRWAESLIGTIASFARHF